MDLRSIINNDADASAPHAHPPPPKNHYSLAQSPVAATSPQSFHHPPPGSFASPTSYYPPQLSPQQQHVHPHRDSRDSHPAASPTARGPVPAYSRPSPSPYPPLATGSGAYNGQPAHPAHPPQSRPSLSPSGGSGHGQTPRSLRESPMSASSYSHPPQPFNPPAPQSQPATPLGPPPAYHRASVHLPRDPQSPQARQRTLSSASYGAVPSTPVQGPKAALVMESPMGYDAQSPMLEKNGHDYLFQGGRERTESVSPKTKVLSRQQSIELRRISQEMESTPVAQVQPIRSIVQPPPAHHQPPFPPPQPQPQPHHQSQSQAHANSLMHQSSPRLDQKHSPTPQPAPQPSSRAVSRASSHASPEMTPARVKVKPDSLGDITAGLVRKRKRNDPIPIWAQKALPNENRRAPRPPQSQQTQQQQQQPPPPPPPAPAAAPPSSSHPPQQSLPPQQQQPPLPRNAVAPGNAAQNGQVNHPNAPRETMGRQWEPAFDNTESFDEIRRLIMNFLWAEVVDRPDGLSRGDEQSHSPWQLEIEAKFGTLIDKSTNDRLDLPILSDAVLDPARRRGMQVQFRSSITEEDHKRFNERLNQQVLEASKPNTNRVKIDYQHKRETDSFYGLTEAAYECLPDRVRDIVKRDSRSKARVTTDSRTGQVLATIIKCRLADLEVYCPCSEYDYRISISLELNYEGSRDYLVEATEASRQGGRKKDRMCYRHQHCQIDLTQVKPIDSGPNGDKTHELEIEVSTEEIIRQGRFNQANMDNNYEQVVDGFLSNIRNLARFVPCGRLQ